MRACRRDRLTLDLANSIPETGLDLTKADLGDLTAVAVAPDGKTVVATLGTFGYRRLSPRGLRRDGGHRHPSRSIRPPREGGRDADIQLRQEDGTVLLAETALRAIPADAEHLSRRGRNGDARRSRCSIAAGRRARASTSRWPIPTRSTAASVTRATDAQGIADFLAHGDHRAGRGLRARAGKGATAPRRRIDPQTTTYVYVRTLPADADIAALAPTWDNVHGRVLRNWHAMAPCMDNWLDLGDPDQVKSFAAMLRRLTDGANFEAFRYMPVTRDMTAGQRSLLYNFLDGTQPVLSPSRLRRPSPRSSK